MNDYKFTGNLTRDPELRYTQGGTAIAEVGVAINRSFKKHGSEEWEEKTSFVDVKAFGKQAENMGQQLTKGMKVLVEGYIEQDTWEKDGQKRSKLMVTANRVQELVTHKKPKDG